MRVLALLFALISLPALAADYTPSPDRGEQPLSELLVAQAQASPQTPQTLPQTLPPGGQPLPPSPPYQDPSKPRPATRHSGDYCCRHCRSNELPCGNSCLPALTAGKKTICKAPSGCACTGAP